MGSSCADSCSTCCRRDSSESATSGFWRLAVAALHSRSAYDSSPNQAASGLKPDLNKEPVPLQGLFGYVRNVADQWCSSKNSALFSFDCDPHQFLPATDRDTIFLIPTSALSPTSPQVCLRCRGQAALLRKVLQRRPVPRNKIHRFSAFRVLSLYRAISKPIARPFQNGFLQDAVSRTLRQRMIRSSGIFRRSVPDTALSHNARSRASEPRFPQRRLWTTTSFIIQYLHLQVAPKTNQRFACFSSG